MQMARQSSIRWRESDLAELRRTVKNYNAKINRQRKKLIEADERYQASQLPSKASVRELRKAIETRQDYNTHMGEMQNFLETGLRFKVDSNTKKSLHATVRDFNAKIDRLTAKAKTQGERASLPRKITEEDILKRARTKEGLKTELQMYKGFMRRGAEERVELPDTKFNIKLTRWQKETMETMVEKVNEARAIEKELRQTADIKYGGKKAGYTRAQVGMNTDPYSEYNPMKLYAYSDSYSDIRARYDLMLREVQPGYWDARTELARINYLELMEEAIGNDPIGKILLKQIKEKPLTDFKRVLLEDDDLFPHLYDIIFAGRKDPEFVHSAKYSTLLETVWKEWNDTDMQEALDEHLNKKART